MIFPPAFALSVSHHHHARSSGKSWRLTILAPSSFNAAQIHYQETSSDASMSLCEVRSLGFKFMFSELIDYRACELRQVR